MLCEFAINFSAATLSVLELIEPSLDAEIRELQRRYYLLLKDEYEARIAKQIAEMNQLVDELNSRDELIASLQEQHTYNMLVAAREAEHWKTRYELLKEQIDGEGDTT